MSQNIQHNFLLVEKVFIHLLAKVVNKFKYRAVWWLFPLYNFDKSTARQRIFKQIRKTVSRSTNKYLSNVEPFFNIFIETFSGLSSKKKESIREQLKKLNTFFVKKNKENKSSHNNQYSENENEINMNKSGAIKSVESRLMMPIKSQLNLYESDNEGNGD
jgi:hypothetical protein